MINIYQADMEMLKGVIEYHREDLSVYLTPEGRLRDVADGLICLLERISYVLPSEEAYINYLENMSYRKESELDFICKHNKLDICIHKKDDKHYLKVECKDSYKFDISLPSETESSKIDGYISSKGDYLNLHKFITVCSKCYGKYLGDIYIKVYNN